MDMLLMFVRGEDVDLIKHANMQFRSCLLVGVVVALETHDVQTMSPIGQAHQQSAPSSI